MIYIANDVEAAGTKLGYHSTLSIGSAVVPCQPIGFREYWEKGLVFYAELKPDSMKYDIEAMRVGCSQLECLEEVRLRNPSFDTESQYFAPDLVLELMLRKCEHPVSAMKRFHAWIEKVRETSDTKVVGITDTVFFDGGRFDLLFSKYSKKKSPYGWSGLDLDSVYRGYRGDLRASLKSLGVLDERTKPHKADQDAVDLAQKSRVLLFEKLSGLR